MFKTQPSPQFVLKKRKKKFGLHILCDPIQTIRRANGRHPRGLRFIPISQLRTFAPRSGTGPSVHKSHVGVYTRTCRKNSPYNNNYVNL